MGGYLKIFHPSGLGVRVGVGGYLKMRNPLGLGLARLGVRVGVVVI